MRPARWSSRTAASAAAVATAVAVIALAGCSSHTTGPGVASATLYPAASGSAGAPAGAGSGAGSASASAGAYDSTRFISCMHDQGIDIPQPAQPTDGTQVSSLAVPDQAHGGPAPAVLAAAYKKCQQFMPNGGYLTAASPQTIEQLLKYARCMRAHGVTDFQDPNRFGGMIWSVKMINEPAFPAAEKACAPLDPNHAPAGSGGN